jgi:hypothetical protein
MEHQGHNQGWSEMTNDTRVMSEADSYLSMPISDEELTELALAGDLDQPLGSDAIAIGDYLNGQEVGLLPEWYMAPVMRRHLRRGPQLVALIVIGTFLLIEAVGLCSTYGQWPFH